jgi:glycosyltransferase involved in cell wall biosynthesis
MKKKRGKQIQTVNNEYPNVSILTPTFNRRKFLPLMIYNINGFLYNKKQLEWFIVDDGKEPLFTEETLQETKQKIYPVKLNYEYISTKKEIGEKRNYLVKHATYKTLIMMDDDDIYFPSYIKTSIDTMKKHNVKFVGSPQMLFIYPKWNWGMAMINCPAKRQCHEATMCFTKKYFNSMGRGFQANSRGEGAKMIDFNENNVITTDITECMVCVCHNNNTLSKDMFAKHKIPAKLSRTGHLDILKNILGDEYRNEEFVDEDTPENSDTNNSGTNNSDV